MSFTSNGLFTDSAMKIAEQYVKMKCKEAVSDQEVVDLAPTEKKEEEKKLLDESIISEHQDYHVYDDSNKFHDDAIKAGLEFQKDGTDHFLVKDSSGDMKGWWNAHTGFGYLHKDCCESNHLKEEAEYLELNSFLPVETAVWKSKESGEPYDDLLDAEMKKIGKDKNDSDLDSATEKVTKGKFKSHKEYANSMINKE